MVGPPGFGPGIFAASSGALNSLVRATSYQTRLRALLSILVSLLEIWNTCFSFIKPFPKSRF